MKIINKTVYVAFDETEFDDKDKCLVYEREKRGITPNLRSFPITFPMQDDCSSCVAYWIPCENAFNMLKDYLEYEYPDADTDKYDGNGWYVVRYEPDLYAYVTKLSAVMYDWNLVMDKIAKHAIDFEGV